MIATASNLHHLDLRRAIKESQHSRTNRDTGYLPRCPCCYFRIEATKRRRETLPCSWYHRFFQLQFTSRGMWVESTSCNEGPEVLGSPAPFYVTSKAHDQRYLFN